MGVGPSLVPWFLVPCPFWMRVALVFWSHVSSSRGKISKIGKVSKGRVSRGYGIQGDGIQGVGYSGR